jgi:hypothetical protein
MADANDGLKDFFYGESCEQIDKRLHAFLDQQHASLYDNSQVQVNAAIDQVIASTGNLGNAISTLIYGLLRRAADEKDLVPIVALMAACHTTYAKAEGGYQILSLALRVKREIEKGEAAGLTDPTLETGDPMIDAIRTDNEGYSFRTVTEEELLAALAADNPHIGTGSGG